ncbi:MAG: hypothetical protein JWQ27_891 [Ferruginibacter sp.]|nr:hypothetical protein [Ferruginibacter sp.]
MAPPTKITFSERELKLAQDKEIILTKTALLQKVAALLEQRVAIIKNLVTGSLQDERLHYALPKIARGENYNGYPYLMMDYPSVFGKEDIFALRTMFWWGHFCSITLQLSGSFLNEYRGRIRTRLQNNPADFFICVSSDPWKHDFAEDNYRPATDLQGAGGTWLFEKNFMKVALKYDLQQLESMDLLLDDAYVKILELVKD